MYEIATINDMGITILEDGTLRCHVLAVNLTGERQDISISVALGPYDPLTGLVIVRHLFSLPLGASADMTLGPYREAIAILDINVPPWLVSVYEGVYPEGEYELTAYIGDPGGIPYLNAEDTKYDIYRSPTDIIVYHLEDIYGNPVMGFG